MEGVFSVRLVRTYLTVPAYLLVGRAGLPRCRFGGAGGRSSLLVFWNFGD